MKQLEEIAVDNILDIPDRHCVFTIPAEHRNYFYWKREDLKGLQDMVYEVINEFANGISYKNREEYQKIKKVLWQSGMIGVVHIEVMLHYLMEHHFNTRS